MFTYFVGFVAFTIALLWIFQIVLLGDIYSFIKINELKDSTESASAVKDGNFDDVLFEIAQKNNICGSVYRIDGADASLVSQAHIETNCILHNIAASSDSILNMMYKGAAAEGTFIEKFIILEGQGTVIPLSGDNSRDHDDQATSVMCSKLVKSGADTYLIVMNCEMVPIGATVDTLRAQLIVITAILLVTAAVVAFVLASRFSSPLVSMSKEARRLAEGNYDVHFTESSAFSETKELGATLNYAASELSKLDKMQKELVANISHDLRTPLTMISGYSEMMRDIPGENTPENAQVIIDETKRLSSLVSDALDLSRLTGGTQKLELTRFDITDMINDTIGRYARLIEHEGYTVDFSFDRHAVVTADETRILQVVYNLINNAINYTGEDKLVTVRQTVSEGKVRIEVIDTGEGIPDDKLERIWDRYYRSGDYHKRPVVGTGLGLSIVKNCLILHGAHFGVSSTLGKGSVFWFELDEQSEAIDNIDSE